MKIIIVCDLMSTFLRFRRFLAQRMVEAGHEVCVIASFKDVDNLDFFQEHSISWQIIEMDRTGISPVSDWKYKNKIRDIFLKKRPNHVFAYQAKAAVWSAIAAKSVDACSVTILFPGLGYLFAPPTTAKQRTVQFASRRLYKHAFSRIQTAIFQNPDDLLTLSTAGLLPDATTKIQVNGSGVPLNQFCHSATRVSPMKFKMATRLLAEKGIREFAAVAGELVDKYGDSVEFHLAGSVDSNPGSISEAELQTWMSRGWIRYHGQVDDMVSYLEDSSVFALPSYYMEGTPRSILEAMAIGRAIVTTNNRGCRETVEEGVNGFLVSQENHASLKAAFEKFIQCPESAIAMGAQSRRIAETKYDVDVVCSKMLQAMDLI